MFVFVFFLFHQVRSGIKGCCCDVRNLDPYRDYRFRIRVENQYGVSDPSPHNSTSRDKLHLEPIARQRFLEPGVTYNPDTSCYFPRDFDLDRPPHDGYTHAPRFLRQVIRNCNRLMTTTTTINGLINVFPEQNRKRTPSTESRIKVPRSFGTFTATRNRP